MPVSADRYMNEYFGRAVARRPALAFTARGIASEPVVAEGPQPPRRIARSGCSRDAAATRLRACRRARRAPRTGRCGAPDGRTLYYVSDRGGAAEHLDAARSAASRRPVTRFTSGRVLWPTISTDGRTIAFERDFGIWTLDTATGEAQPVSHRAARRCRPAPAVGAPDVYRSIRGDGALARRQEGRVRRARRGVRGVRARTAATRRA